MSKQKRPNKMWKNCKKKKLEKKNQKEILKEEWRNLQGEIGSVLST